ncbi:hypothetical protein [Vibrio alginolyticus]|uniref:hypothetical protein n=1 Tax=Vibrio alginolyticus TaxID=663 RepID=UPI003755246F
MDNIVRNIDNLIENIAEYLQAETTYTVQKRTCSDFCVPTKEITISSDNNELALIKPFIYMVPMNDAYAQIECHLFPSNVFRDKASSKLYKNANDEYEFVGLEQFLEEMLSGLDKSKECWRDFYK